MAIVADATRNVDTGAAHAGERGPLLLGCDQTFSALWNRRSFAFEHVLADHPLFSPEELRAFAARTLPEFTYWQSGMLEVGESWNLNRAEKRSLDETIAGIAQNDSLVIIKHAEQDQVIGPLLRDLLTEMVNLSPPDMRDDMTVGESIIFITSPRRVTKYHLDLEGSCLLQVRGRKTVNVFDEPDRLLLPHEEIEGQCCGNHDAAIFKPERQAEARTYKLEPGKGVHLPSMAPHWVVNGDSVSVSINLNFEFRSVHHRLRPIYRFNRRLRRFGFAPNPPGRNRTLDDVKATLENGYANGVKVLRRARRRLSQEPTSPAELYPTWKPKRPSKDGGG